VAAFQNPQGPEAKSHGLPKKGETAIRHAIFGRYSFTNYIAIRS
jgi:hypothetical protein